METVNSKSVLTTTFHLGTFQVPIRLYKTTDVFGLSGQLFHDGCGGKIRQWKTCENHPNTIDPATFSGIQVGNKVVPLTPELKTQLLDGNARFQAIGVFKMQQLTSLIVEQKIVPVAQFEMAPEQYFEKVFSTLLSRLRIRKQFLLASFGKDKMRRFGILLPSGIFMAIHYANEVRDRRFEPAEIDRQCVSAINAELDSLEMNDFPELTTDDMYERIQQWFTDIATDRKIVAYKNKAKVDA